MLGSSNSSPILLDNLSILLNGTKALDYNGLNPKSLNITAASIGAATSSHTHTSLQAISSTPNTEDLNPGYFSKICTVSIHAIYRYFVRTYNGILSYHGRPTTYFFRLHVWLKQQRDMGQSPYISLIMTSDNNILHDQVIFYAVVDEMTTSVTTISIYAKIINTYTTMQLFFAAGDRSLSNIVVDFKDSPYIQTLPESANGEITRHKDSILVLDSRTIPVASWDTTTKTYSYNHDGITAGHHPEVAFNKNSIPAASESGITAHTEDGRLILTCTEAIPTAQLTVERVILTLVG